MELVGEVAVAMTVVVVLEPLAERVSRYVGEAEEVDITGDVPPVETGEVETDELFIAPWFFARGVTPPLLVPLWIGETLALVADGPDGRLLFIQLDSMCLQRLYELYIITLYMHLHKYENIYKK